MFQLLPAAQKYSTFHNMWVVSRMADNCALPMMSGIFNFSCQDFALFDIVPSAPMMIGITVTTMNNPINSHSGKMCSCGKMCKNNRGLRIHQEKTKCQTPENKLVAPPQKSFVSLQNIILSSLITFDEGVYYRISDNTFIPISNSEKPVAGNKCYVQTKDIIIHPLTEYLSNDINQCGTTSCHTCNIFIDDQSFKSNLTGKEYKTLVMIDFHVAPHM